MLIKSVIPSGLQRRFYFDSLIERGRITNTLNQLHGNRNTASFLYFSSIFIDEKLVIFLFCPTPGQKFRLWVLRGYRIRIFTPEAENHRAPRPRWGLSSPIFIDEKLVIFLFCHGVGQKFRLWVLRGYRIRVFTPEAENHRAPWKLIRNSECGIRNYGIASGDNISTSFTETLQGERTTFAP